MREKLFSYTCKNSEVEVEIHLPELAGKDILAIRISKEELLDKQDFTWKKEEGVLIIEQGIAPGEILDMLVKEEVLDSDPPGPRPDPLGADNEDE